MGLRIVRHEEKRPRKSRYRRLRHYQRIAYKENRCHGCVRSILPGDEYEADVVIKVAGGIYVAKYHFFPPCDEPDPFGEDEDHDEVCDEASEILRDVA